ncbi:MAG: 3-hydroxyacyl-CoA dehydrogenase NAD-binding domain-containing protein [Pseudorhodobacter sp.]
MAVIGVVGLGVMGLGIAQTYAAAGFDVIASDGHAPARATALDRIRKGLARRVSSGKMTEAALEDLLGRVQIAPDLADLAPCALIIEAIAEKLDAKQDLFAKLELVAPNAVLATNTSSLPVSEIRKGLARPDRLLGLHFFNPAPVMKLVELVITDADEAAITLARQVTEKTGKTVIACADRPGFIVNRCARPFYGEALAMLEEGCNAAEIDAAMEAAGYRLGPFALIDLIGADINLAATEGLATAMGGHPRYHIYDALRQQVAKGDLGRKTGRGFIVGQDLPKIDAPNPDIALRIEAMLANEAATLLEEGAVTEADVDRALKLGLNFPRGPFAAARAHGLNQVREVLMQLERQAPDEMKPRYRISPALLALN